MAELFQVNNLIQSSFPIPDLILESWYRKIKQYAPELTLQQLEKIHELFACNKLDYDNRKGVQNIFTGYLYLLKKNQNIIAEHLNKSVELGNSEDENKYRQMQIANTLKINKFSKDSSNVLSGVING